jgi:hypothetical protein
VECGNILTPGPMCEMQRGTLDERSFSHIELVPEVTKELQTHQQGDEYGTALSDYAPGIERLRRIYGSSHFQTAFWGCIRCTSGRRSRKVSIGSNLRGGRNYYSYRGASIITVGRTPSGHIRSLDGMYLATWGNNVLVDRVVSRLRVVQGDVLLFSSGHFIRVLAARWIGIEPTVHSRSVMLKYGQLERIGL